MKATGIIRRMDDLGRIVIPRNIRKNLDFRANDSFEIFIEGNDTICFRKYRTNLYDEIDELREKIISHTSFDQKTALEIGSLLIKIQELLEDEE